MTTSHWSQLRALFDELADLPIQTRTARIANEQLDTDLRAELIRLLAAHDNAASILDSEPPGQRLTGSAWTP